MNEQPAYLLEQIRAHHGGRLVLDLSQLSVKSGETLCLIGPPGAGKSTLLRLLAGLSPPCSGGVALNGGKLYCTLISVALRRRVTLIFQRPLLLAGTVLDNVEYGLKIRNQSDASRKALAILERVHLEHLGNRPATAISGGEAQLIALARALAFQPEVLLLDEPTNNLDPARVALVEEVVMEDHRQRGTTIIWATHNHFQARRVGDLIALLLDGKIVEVAAAHQFFDAPVDPRTAAFVQGKMVY